MCAVVAALILATASAFGGESVKAKIQTPETEPSLVSGSLGLNVVSGQVFRGIVLDSNLSYQPSLKLSVPINVKALGLDTGALRLSTTQFINQNSPTAGWFRSEVDLGIALTKGPVTLIPSYQLFSSPTSKFNSSQGINLRVELDDSFTGLPLKPYASAFFGTEGNSGTGPKPGSYYELGVAPSFKVGTSTFSVPAAIGYGDRGYYTKDHSLAFTTVGLTSVTPITESVSFKAGVQYWNTSVNGKDQQSYVSTSVGLGLSF